MISTKSLLSPGKAELNSTSLMSACGVPKYVAAASRWMTTESVTAAPMPFVPVTVIVFTPTASDTAGTDQLVAAATAPAPPVRSFVHWIWPITFVLAIPWMSNAL